MPKTTTDISSFTPAQQAAFGEAAKLALPGSVAAFGNTPQTVTKPVGIISTDQGVAALTKAQAQQTKLAAPAIANVPKGWDAQTYANFKSANPTLEPTAQDTAKMTDTDKSNATGQTKVTLINPNTEQTVTFNDAAINKDNIQQYLGAGYQMSDAEGSVPTWLSPNGVTTHPAETAAEKALTTAQNDLDVAKAKLTNFNVSNDPQLTSLLSGITSQWDARIATMKQSLDSHTEALKTTGIRLGQQWTGGVGGMTGSIISGEETATLAELATLEGQKQQALTAAQSAYENQQWSRYGDLVNMAQKAYDNQLTQVTALQKAQATQDTKLQDAQKTALQSMNIAKLFVGGVTKPEDILTALQKDGDTTTNLADINKALDTLSPKADKVNDKFNFSQGQNSQLLASGLSTDEVQALHDFYNGKGDAPTLTPEQTAAVHDALNGTAAKKAASTVASYAQLHPKTAAGGKPYHSGSLTYTTGDIAGGAAKLEASKHTGPSADGEYADPDLYLSMAKAWTGGGGAIKDFLKNFPVSSYINPGNSYVTPQINDLVRQDAGVVSTAKPTTDLSAQIDAIFKK